MNHASTPQSKLLEIEIRVNTRVIFEYLLSPQGLWRHICLSLLTVLWLLAGTTMQFAMATEFPAAPAFPAVWVCAFLSTRRGPVCAVTCAFATGLFIDAASFNPPGPSSIMLCLAAMACAIINCKFPASRRYLASTACLGLLSTFIYVLGKLLFCRPFAAFSSSLSLMPRYLLGGMLLSVPACLLIFGIMDICEQLLVGVHKEQP